MKIIVNKNRCSNNIVEDKKISIVLMTPIIVLAAQYFFLVINDLLGILNENIIKNTSKLLVGIMFIYAMPIVFKGKKVTFIFVYLITIIIFLCNFIIFPENRQNLNTILFPFFFMCLPAFVFSLCIQDWNILKQIIRKAGIIVFIFGTSIGVLVFTGSASIGDYSMTLSYYLLLPTIIYLDELLDKPAFKPAMVTFLSLAVILALGSRGAILCIFLFVSLKVMRPNNKMNLKRIFCFIIFLCLGILTFVNLNKIFEFFYNFLIGYGIRSRTLELFLFNMGHLSGRDDIYQNVIEGILNRPFLGIGIGGDRRVNGGEGFYTHNFFLEVLSNYGIFFGSLLIITQLLLILNILFSKDKGKYSMGIIWLSLGFIPLLVSGSYLTDINYWIFNGLIINYFIRSKS